MPRQTRQAPRTTEVDVEDGHYNIPGLEFNESLTWRAGKPVSVGDLFSRLQALSRELGSKEVDDIKAPDLTQLAQDLAHPNLLGHKDKGIRAWTISCVLDILTLCAPHAPYRPQQVKDIFTVINSSILPVVNDPSNGYHSQHLYIMKQLVDSQSIVLICDIPEGEKLLSNLFSVCFDLVSGAGKTTSSAELSFNLEFQIQQLLTLVIEEATITQDVTDIIISQFLRVDPRSSHEPTHKRRHSETKDKSQSTLLLKDYPPAYNLAKAICAACSDKLSPPISQYFNNIITNASAALADEDPKAKTSKRAMSPSSDSDHDEIESLNDLSKAHRLVREIWRAAPDLLASIIPQIEVELAADSPSLRQLAVETIGDMIAGIGIAGFPDLPPLDPTQYALPTVENSDDNPLSSNPLLKPTSPKPFISVHSSAYQAFLGRRIDKAVGVRMAWAKATSKILLTQAGGLGFSGEEQIHLLSSYEKMLKDVDEKVRLVALQSLRSYPYHVIIRILGSDGGLAQPQSVLSTVAERMSDKKVLVREQAMFLLGNMWGVASRDIEEGNENVRKILAPAPSRLFLALLTKDSFTPSVVDRVLFECLLPLNFPPMKGKNLVVDSEQDDGTTTDNIDPETIRVRRLLTLVRDLDDKARMIFFSIQKRQADMSKAITIFLKLCEDYNGGISDDSTEGKRVEEQLTRLIDNLSKQQPEPSKVSNDLWKFAKAHDRRNYQLIRFAVSPEHDYRTMAKAIKELSKRIRDAVSGSTSMLETLTAILYQSSLIIYNRSHIPAIMEFARSPDTSYADAAQEILKEISAKVPEVLKTHIQVLCQELEQSVPSEKSPESASAVDALKACAVFSKRFPGDIPSSRKFELAMMQFIQFSSSAKAAKHATSIILNTSTKKELRAKEIMTKAVKRYRSDAPNKLAQLAAIAQVCLLAPQAASAEEDAILEIAVVDTLQKNKSSATSEKGAAWVDVMDEETTAKQISLQILVNRCRSGDKSSRDSFNTLARSVIEMLINIIVKEGEIVASEDTPLAQKNRLRLDAARFIFKICRHQPVCEELVTPQMFMSVAHIVLSPPHEVRRGLISQLKKYLTQNKLNPRWMTIFFLLAFEPDEDLQRSTMAWLKARTAHYTHYYKQARSGESKSSSSNVMEMTLPRLLSILTHHPDYPVKGSSEFDGELLDFAKYIVFYLQAVASEDNLSLIFHVAQRVKQAQDALTDDEDVLERLYVLSDLAQATIRNYADLMPSHAKGINLLQTWPGKAHLPATLFKPINGHTKAQEIAAKNYLPEDVALSLEQLVRRMVRGNKTRDGAAKSRSAAAESKKRKSSVSVDMDEGDAETVKSAKKAKSRRTSTLPIRKTPQAKKRRNEPLSAEQPSRKSARTNRGKSVNYIESDEEEEERMDDGDVVKYNPSPTTHRMGGKHAGKVAEVEDTEQMIVDEEAEAEASDAFSAGGEKDDESVNGEVEAGAEMTDDDMEAEKENNDSENGDGVENDEANPAEKSEDEAELDTTPLKENGNKRNTRAKSSSAATRTRAKTTAQSSTTKASNSKAKNSTVKKATPSKGASVQSKKKSDVSEATPPSRRATRSAKAEAVHQ